MREPVHNLFFETSEMARALSEARRERYSLVPYDNYRSSLISVSRESNTMSRDSIRKSSLYESFSSKKTHEDPQYQGSECRYIQDVKFLRCRQKTSCGHKKSREPERRN